MVIKKTTQVADIKTVLKYWRYELALAFVPELPLEAPLNYGPIQVKLKHFMDDMYSVMNYAEIVKLIPGNEEELHTSIKRVKSVYPDFDSDEWLYERVLLRRNVSTHRHLLRIVVKGNDFVSPDVKSDMSLELATIAIWMNVVRVLSAFETSIRDVL